MSIGLTFDLASVGRLQERIERLGRVNRRELLEQLAGVVESQVRRRISEEKESPDGERWQAWTSDYAATRHGGQSLLEGDGGLIDSVTSEIDGDQALTGSNLVYFAIHNFGGTPDMAPGPAGIPARQSLGFNQDNLDEIEAVADRWLDNHLEAA
ncbi:phage virion morphogenesis protein [Marinobacter sp. OP 3.4]|uniref:phage virion morphogenesis protein n=1 Tax=Marinobacter sp. OP 3.4 TaxID=3076501 RepID=UPI002E246720